MYTPIDSDVMKENPLKKIHILVVEDEKFMRSLICRLLYELQTGKVTDVDNGKDGIKMLAADAPYVDVILLDIQMPDMNGLEFLQLVRHSGGALQNPNSPVIMLTGHSQDNQVAQAVRLGIQGYILKPVSKKVMLTRIIHAIK